MRQDDAPVRTPGFTPLLGESQEVTRVVGQDRAASLRRIAELVLIRGPEMDGLTSGLAVNSMLRQDRGQYGRDGFIQVELHVNDSERGCQGLDSRVGSSASCSAISRSISSR